MLAVRWCRNCRFNVPFSVKDAVGNAAMENPVLAKMVETDYIAGRASIRKSLDDTSIAIGYFGSCPEAILWTEIALLVASR